MKDVIENIELINLFHDIKKEDLKIMFSCLGAYTKTYKKNEIIYLENHDIRFIGIILYGRVNMIKEDSNGNNSILVYLKIGDLFGETFACSNLTISKVSFVSANKCKILFIPFHKVLYTCKMTCTFHHRLIENMIEYISTKNVMLMNKIEIISKKTIREKIISYLQLQRENFGCDDFEIELGRVELAEYLCTDRSALTRELNNMKAEKIIEFEKNRFKLLKI